MTALAIGAFAQLPTTKVLTMDVAGAINAKGGAPGGDKDLACANAAIARVADKLK